MRKQPCGILLLLALLSGLFSGIQAQTNTDQIVFTEGWVRGFGAPVKYPRYARSEFPTDPVIPLLLANQSIQPANQNGDSGVNWEVISADENGLFKHEHLTSGGLYLEYTSPAEKVVIFDASGHGKAHINGVPREGDHFGFGTTRHPVKLKKALHAE
ncbi:MAG: hypothetical protein R6V72_03265 [Cyclobacterium sp.]|uniref:hypothetical protein n=1 Tax=unclassified Cyclobacterium TaxID=2615055 RepID=UPI0013D10543|nr:hypothetical protein [Cyclobacterium sp. SYSU L10401]